MVAYVGIAPLIEAVLSGVNRKIALVSLDFGRLLLLVLMAFMENTYQIVLLSFVFFVLSAGFTPLYQSVIPDVVPEKDAYARALSWSRIAYTLESILSPTIAVALLTFITGSFLFLVAALALIGSIFALAVASFPPRVSDVSKKPFIQRVFKGMSIYIKTPRAERVISPELCAIVGNGVGVCKYCCLFRLTPWVIRNLFPHSDGVLRVRCGTWCLHCPASGSATWRASEQ